MNDKAENSAFDLDNLRTDIRRIWGEHGAHMDVFNELVSQWALGRTRLSILRQAIESHKHQKGRLASHVDEDLYTLAEEIVN